MSMNETSTAAVPPLLLLGAGTFVIVADPADVAIRVYRACGFAGTQSQFSFELPSLSASSP